MMNPREAPENRPSVISAVLPPRPAPMSAAVWPSICVRRVSPLSVFYAISPWRLRSTYLGHARGALRALVAEDDDHPRGDLPVLERLEEWRDAGSVVRCQLQ